MITLISLLLLAAPARAMTPEQLSPMEKWAYDQYTAKNDTAAAQAFLAKIGWLRDCEAVVLDHAKAASLPDRPASVDEKDLTDAEMKHVVEALKLRDQARAGTLKPRAKAPKAKPVALKPTTAAFLKEIGLDPASTDIRAISGDKITTKSGKLKSLEALAVKRDEDGVKRFVATRVFLRAYRENPATPFPSSELYDPYLLTPDEVDFVAMQLRQNGGK